VQVRVSLVSESIRLVLLRRLAKCILAEDWEALAICAAMLHALDAAEKQGQLQ